MGFIPVFLCFILFTILVIGIYHIFLMNSLNEKESDVEFKRYHLKSEIDHLKQIVQQLQSQLQESTPAASLHPSSPTDKKDLPDNIEILDRNDNTDFTKIPATKSDQKKSVEQIELPSPQTADKIQLSNPFLELHANTPVQKKEQPLPIIEETSPKKSVEIKNSVDISNVHLADFVSYLEPESSPRQKNMEHSVLASKKEEKMIQSASSTEKKSLIEKKQSVTKENSENIGQMELQIGQKILGWVAVFLFILGAGFFIQLAINYGWLNPMNRLIGLFVCGLIFLSMGFHYFKKGWRRFSVMLNSTGITILFLGGYYAKMAVLFSPQISSMVMIGSVVLGFSLAAFYWSSFLGLVAILGGLAVPLLIKETMFESGIFYLLLLNVVSICLINWIRRTEIVLVAFFGTLFLFIRICNLSIGHEAALNGKLVFLLVFALLYYVDTWLSVFRAKRSILWENTLRALLTPLIFFFGTWILLYHNEETFSIGSFFDGTGWEFFQWLDGPIALTLFIIYGITAYCFYRHEKNRTSWSDSLSLFPLMTALSFSFLAMSIPLLLSAAYISVGWIALAVAILYLAVWADPYITQEELPKYKTFYRNWASLFFLLGITRLYCWDFICNLYPVYYYLYYNLSENTFFYPFVNKLALPVLISSLLLVVGSRIIIFYRRKKERYLNLSQHGRNVFITWLILIFFNVGFWTFWLLMNSEVFTFTVLKCYQADISPIAINAWACAKYCSLVLALSIFLLGYWCKNQKILRFSLIILLVPVFKLLFMDLWCHWLFGGGPIPGWTNLCPCFTSMTFGPLTLTIPYSEIIALNVPRFSVPIWNSFAMVFVIYSTVLLEIALVYHWKSLYFQNEFGFKIGLTCGTCGLILLFNILSLECYTYFLLPKADALSMALPRTFFSVYSVWNLWMIMTGILFFIGWIMRSLPIRIAGYTILGIQFLPIFIFTFLNPIGRTYFLTSDIDIPLLNLNALTILLYSCMMIILSIILHSSSSRLHSGDRLLALPTGLAGLFLLWLLFSFETWRYFGGIQDGYPTPWLQLTSLNVLWSFLAIILLVLGMIKRSIPLRAVSLVLLILIASKFLFMELFFRPEVFIFPIINIYGFNVLLVSFILLVYAVVIFRWSSNRLNCTEQEQILLNIEQFFAGFFGIAVIFFLWIGWSLDLRSAILRVPESVYGQPAFLAEMALSIFWSIFAGILLFIGFWTKKSILRWLAIALFALTTLKVMLNDITYLAPSYRVGALFTLAIVLMLASAAYQRFRLENRKKNQ